MGQCSNCSSRPACRSKRECCGTGAESMYSTDGGACRLRIIAVNDVYELTNFPRLRTLIQEMSSGIPPDNVITTLAGDFLAPSLLSSLDAGVGMIRVLNAVPIDIVCFGNHESDIPYCKLIQRIDEFKGTWLNSNMPDFKPTLPTEVFLTLKDHDGIRPTRKVAFAGFCIGGGKFQSVYRDDAFGGAARTMQPVIEAATSLTKTLKACDPNLDEVIPLTHQDVAEDITMACTGMFPVIVGGHDHEVVDEVHGRRGCHVVKAGMDAHTVAIIDLFWTGMRSEPPTVKVTMTEVAGYEPDFDLEQMIYKINRPVRELESAMLYSLEPGEELSSVNVKFKVSSMARKIADAIRDVLEADAAFINSGAVRGKKDYTSTVSFGDLKKECPYPSPMVVARVPFAVLQRAVKESRRPWWDVPEGSPPQEAPSALQVDTGIQTDDDHLMQTIAEEVPDPEYLYNVALDTRVIKKNLVLRDYSLQYPDRIPPEDSGRPVLPILVEYFCSLMWKRLFKKVCGYTHGRRRSSVVCATDEQIDQVFHALDLDGSGQIDQTELRTALEQHLGDSLSSSILVTQMITLMDDNGDGFLSQDELVNGLRKILLGSANGVADDDFN